MMRFKEKNGVRAKGLLWCSQVAPGHENGLKVRVYGSKGGLEWVQADPNYLWYTPFGEPKRLITRGGAGSGAAAARVTRIPPGTRKAIWKASPISTPRRRVPSMPSARARPSMRP